VIKLSGALQRFAPGKEDVENVHGVRKEFLEVRSAIGFDLFMIATSADPGVQTL
jgi:hypothetical protein